MHVFIPLLFFYLNTDDWQVLVCTWASAFKTEDAKREGHSTCRGSKWYFAVLTGVHFAGAVLPYGQTMMITLLYSQSHLRRQDPSSNLRRRPYFSATSSHSHLKSPSFYLSHALKNMRTEYDGDRGPLFKFPIFLRFLLQIWLIIYFWARHVEDSSRKPHSFVCFSVFIISSLPFISILIMLCASCTYRDILIIQHALYNPLAVIGFPYSHQEGCTWAASFRSHRQSPEIMGRHCSGKREPSEGKSWALLLRADIYLSPRPSSRISFLHPTRQPFIRHTHIICIM